MGFDYGFEWVGGSPLLVHHDNVDGQDAIAAWRKTDEGKKTSKAGDDRSPAWTWQTYLYHHDELLVIPADNIMGAILSGGSEIPLGSKNQTYKALSQTGLFILDEACPILVKGKPIHFKSVSKLRDLPFARQCEEAKKLGFELSVKKVAIKNSGKITKHVRVRPMFRQWSLKGTIRIIDDFITEEVFTKIMKLSGIKGGLCDRRPGVKSPKIPGSFGTANVRVWKL